MGFSLIFIIFFASFTFAQTYVDGRKIDFPDQEFLDSNNRTLIPIRFIAEEMGATVDWDGATRTVYIWTAGSGSGSKTTALTEADIKEAKELSD